MAAPPKNLEKPKLLMISFFHVESTYCVLIKIALKCFMKVASGQALTCQKISLISFNKMPLKWQEKLFESC